MKVSELPQRLLMGPGPSHVSDRVLQAMAHPTVGHLDPTFIALMDDIADMLRETFGTTNAATLPISGTGSAGMEAALVNVIEPGDVAIIGVNGVFGTRMVDVATRAGASVIPIEAPWGEPVPPERLLSALDQQSNAKVLAVVHAETSTGVEQPLDELGSALAERDTLFLVDAVTSLGGIAVDVDRRGIDLCYSGTQKCLSAPPGLAPLTLSTKALECVGKRSRPVQSWYLDMTLIGAYWATEGQKSRAYHHTAPINELYGLHEALAIVRDEGLAQRIARHRELGERLHRELQDRGWRLFAKEGHRLPQLTSAYPPEGVDEVALRRELLATYSIEIGGGLGPVAGEIVRIGLMGATCTEVSLQRFLGAIDTISSG